jgi:hypothetical protein
MVLMSLPSNSGQIWFLTLANVSVMFLANAEEYYTGTMRTNVNGIGVTEIQILQMFGLGIQSYYVHQNPTSKVGFFERSISQVLKETFKCSCCIAKKIRKFQNF